MATKKSATSSRRKIGGLLRISSGHLDHGRRRMAH